MPHQTARSSPEVTESVARTVRLRPCVTAPLIRRNLPSARFYALFQHVTLSLLSSMIIVALLISSKADARNLRGCRKIGKELLIDEEGCELLMVRINGCAGHCHSMSVFDPTLGKMRRDHSTCCRIADSEDVEIELTCNSGSRTLKIPNALACECSECAADSATANGRFFV